MATALALMACTSASAATITEFPITNSGSHTPRFLTTGFDGKIWYTDGGNPGGIGTISTDGLVQGRPFSGGSTFDIAVAADNLTYWSAPELDKVFRRPLGGGSEAVNADDHYAVAIDVNGVAKYGRSVSVGGGQYEHWICDYDYPSNSGGCSLHNRTPQDSRITGLVLGPDGKLWGTEYESDLVVRFSGTSDLIVQLPSGARPYSLGLGPDNNIWVAEYGTDSLARITPDGGQTHFPLPPLSGPNDVVTGPDGNLWFPEFRSNKIGCMTLAGKVSEYPIPTPSTAPWGITAGPDGNIWFTESNTSKIGRLKIDSPCGGDANAVQTGAGATGSADATAPSFTEKLALSPSTFRVAAGSTALNTRKRKAPAGSKFKYGLSEPATVTIAIQRPTIGRKVGGKCKTKTRKNRKRAKCTFYKTVGTLTRKAAQGAVSNAFSGRLGSKKLKRGKYRAAATAKDAAGNASAPSNASFTIVR